jgi:metal-responsive CopG/Arc/MetJ family transcriptional regulator
MERGPFTSTLNITIEHTLFRKLEQTRRRQRRARSEFIRTAVGMYLLKASRRQVVPAYRADEVVRWGEGYEKRRVRWQAMRNRYRRRRHRHQPLKCIAVKVSAELLDRVEAFSQKHRLSKSHVLTEALVTYIGAIDRSARHVRSSRRPGTG